MCDVGQSNDSSSGLQTNWIHKKELPPEVWQFILNNLHVKKLHIVGTEPLLYPHFDNLINLISVGRDVEVTTNGWLMHQWTNTLKKCKNVNVSIDGLEDTHDSIRGVKGAFRRAFDGILNLKKLGVKTRISFAVIPENVKDILPLYDLATKNGIPIIFNHYNYIHPSSCSNLCQTSNMYVNPADVDTNEIMKILIKRPKIQMFPILKTKKLLDLYYKSPPTTYINKSCSVISSTLKGEHFAISSDGSYIVSNRCWMKGDLGNAINGLPNKDVLISLSKNVKKLPPPCQRLCCAGNVIP
jgi:sulfatase maturation enzyme AslB (radical SAM superfamily)